MPSFNKVILMGNATRDAEARFTPNGTPTCSFSLAINRSYKDSRTNEKREEVSFFECEAWSKTAETLVKYVKKGTCLLVEGRLKQETWDDKQTGQKRSKVKIVVDTFQFAGSRPADGSSAQESRPARQSAPAQQQQQQDQGQDDLSMPEENVPF